MAVRVGPRSIAYVSRYENREQADSVCAAMRAEILKQFSEHIVAPPTTIEGEVVGECTSEN